jgi:hypothetical protein
MGPCPLDAQHICCKSDYALSGIDHTSEKPCLREKTPGLRRKVVFSVDSYKSASLFTLVPRTPLVGHESMILYNCRALYKCLLYLTKAKALPWEHSSELSLSS